MGGRNSREREGESERVTERDGGMSGLMVEN